MNIESLDKDDWIMIVKMYEADTGLFWVPATELDDSQRIYVEAFISGVNWARSFQDEN